MTRILALCIVVALSGCTILYDGKYNYDQGWRVATVIFTSTVSGEIRHTSLDCRKGSDSQSPYVYVRYLRSFAPRHAIVPIVDPTQWRSGQRLYLNIKDCSVTPTESGN